MTRATAGAPAWAWALVMAVCAEADVATPRLTWRRAAREPSSGLTHRQAGRLTVTAGSDPLDQRLTLLHELAHWLAPEARRRGRRQVAHHGAEFYARAFALYAAHGVPAAEALAREGGRYPSALRHARALGVSGADIAWSERRAVLRERAARRVSPRIVVPEHAVRLVRDGRWTRCAVCGVRVVGPLLAFLRRRGGHHVTWATG